MASPPEILRGQRKLFDEFAAVDGYVLRVLHEATRVIATRRITAVEVRLHRSDWIMAALHKLPPGQYRIQLIAPNFITKGSVTVDWKGLDADK